jgi:hypothetical protein
MNLSFKDPRSAREENGSAYINALALIQTLRDLLTDENATTVLNKLEGDLTLHFRETGAFLEHIPYE